MFLIIVGVRKLGKIQDEFLIQVYDPTLIWKIYANETLDNVATYLKKQSQSIRRKPM